MLKITSYGMKVGGVTALALLGLHILYLFMVYRVPLGALEADPTPVTLMVQYPAVWIIAGVTFGVIIGGGFEALFTRLGGIDQSILINSICGALFGLVSITVLSRFFIGLGLALSSTPQSLSWFTIIGFALFGMSVHSSVVGAIVAITLKLTSA